MLKKDVENLLRSVDPDNASKVYASVKEYFRTGSKWNQAGDMLELIPKFVWKNLSEGMQENFQSMSLPPQYTSAGDAKEMLANRLREAVGEFFHDTYVQHHKDGKVHYYKHNTEERILLRQFKDGAELVPVLLAEFVSDQDEPIVVGEGNNRAYQNDGTVRQAIEHYLSRVRKLADEPVVWSTDAHVECFGRPTIEPDASVPFPNIRGFFERMSDPEAFAAWVWGVYSDEYKGRRCPWLKGGALIGKSLIMNTTLNEMFGVAFVSCGAGDERKGDKFFTSSFEHAKLALVPDNQNKQMYMSEWLKSMSGKDNIRVERKFADATSKPLSTNVMIMSNFYPEFYSKDSATSRAMPITLRSGDFEMVPDLEAKVLLEVPGFLAWAKSCYETLCADNYHLQLSEETYNMIEEATQRHEEQWWTHFNEFYTLDSDGFVTATDIRDNVRLSQTHNRYFFKNFLEYLEYKYSIVGIPDGNRFVYKGIVEKRGTGANSKTLDLKPKDAGKKSKDWEDLFT